MQKGARITSKTMIIFLLFELEILYCVPERVPTYENFFGLIFYVRIVSKKNSGFIVYLWKFLPVLKQKVMSVFFGKITFDKILTETQL